MIPELVAPAGNAEKLRIALKYGADAVYCAGKEFGLRARAGNLTMQEMADGTAFAHSLGKKVYVTVNIFARDHDLEKLPSYLYRLADIGVDALIVSDPGVMSLCRKLVPKIPLHLSTQANTTNSMAAGFWADQGVSRIVLARELTAGEIKTVADETGMDLEVFVHGALCMSYSGRCTISEYLTGRSANRGDCTHPCRWEYSVVEKKRPDLVFPVEEDEHGTYFFNSRDLCLIGRLPELFGAGVKALKIEGRMKSIHYAAVTVRAYRAALDAIADAGPEGYTLDAGITEDLKLIANRDYTEGFFAGNPSEPKYSQEKISAGQDRLLGRIDAVNGDLALVDVRGGFDEGQRVTVVRRQRKSDFTQAVTGMYDREDTPVTRARPNEKILLRFDRPVEPDDLIRTA